MIPDSDKKIQCIIERIRQNQWRIEHYGAGWYLYRMILDRRTRTNKICEFLRNSDSLELIYATLDAWGMNSRRAKLIDFDNFKKIIGNCEENFKEINKMYMNRTCIENLYDSLEQLLENLYKKLRIMESKNILISNSKLLHFLFPQMLMPIDGKHTLTWLYGNGGESLYKYLEVVSFSFDVMRQNLEWIYYLNDNGNVNIPKLIDNVIWKLQENNVS